MAKKWSKTEINTVLDSEVLRNLDVVAEQLGRSKESILSKFKTENKKLDEVVTLYVGDEEVSELTVMHGEFITITAKLKDGKYNKAIRWYFQGEVLGISVRNPNPLITTCTAEIANIGKAKVGIVYEGINKSVLITVA